MKETHRKFLKHAGSEVHTRSRVVLIHIWNAVKTVFLGKPDNRSFLGTVTTYYDQLVVKDHPAGNRTVNKVNLH